MFSDNAPRALDGAHRERFAQHRVFRAITYVARRDTYLSYPTSADDAGQGMFCRMFVAVTCQVAAFPNDRKQT